MKAVLCILDGCNPKSFKEALEGEINKNPDNWFYKELSKAFYSECISSFPTITPTEHATLMTGKHPNEHGIVGMQWGLRKNTSEIELINYMFINDLEAGRIHPKDNIIIRLIKRVLHLLNLRTWIDFTQHLWDFSVDLNDNHLTTETIFQHINTYNDPKKLIPKEKGKTINFKEFIFRGIHLDNFIHSTISSILRWRSLKSYLKKHFPKSPEFIVYWKTHTDKISHKHGPRSDKLKGEIIEGMDRAKNIIKYYHEKEEDVLLIITADHGQSEIGDNQNAVHMDELVNRTLQNNIEVAINGRLIYFYLKHNVRNDVDFFNKVVTSLKKNSRIDQIIFKRSSSIMVITETQGQPQELHTCDLSAYPYAIDRIKNLMSSSRVGDIVVTLKKGYSTHENFKGDHGSLLDEDSRVPLLIHKFQKDIKIPKISLLSQFTQAITNPIQQRISRQEPIIEIPLEVLSPEHLPRSIDIVPTILHYLGLPHDDSFPGKPLNNKIDHWYNNRR